jgi:cyanate lyase
LGILSSFKTKKMTGALEKKLSLDLSGKEPSDWYYLDDKKVLRVRITNVHGSANLSIGAAKDLRNSLKLDEEGLKRLYNCPMKGKDYENKIRSMGYVQ